MDVAVLPSVPSFLAFMTDIDYDLFILEDRIIKVFYNGSYDKFMYSLEKYCLSVN